MKVLTASLLAIVCLSSMASAKAPSSTSKKAKASTVAAKDCSGEAKKLGKCGAKSGRAPASVSVAAEASVRREAADKSYSETPNDPGSK